MYEAVIFVNDWNVRKYRTSVLEEPSLRRIVKSIKLTNFVHTFLKNYVALFPKNVLF